jgi:exosortase
MHATTISDKIYSERWHLAIVSREEMYHLFFLSLIGGLMFIMFHLLGNTVEDVHSRSAFVWMVARWSDKISFGADYSHGYLIPFVSLGVIWLKRKELVAAPKKICQLGLLVIVGALLMHWLGAKMQQTRISLIGLIGLFWGIPFYLMGWQVAKILIFPCAYLIFCVPLNFLDSMSFPLQMLATDASNALLNGLGIAAIADGSRIRLLYNPDISYEVAAACSGLRSLLAMTAITAVYAYLTQKTLVKKWILFLSSIPLAVIGNIVRVTTIFLVAQAFSKNIADGLYHSYSGYIVFAASISCMVAFGSLLNINYGELFRKWKHEITSHTS